mgnify:CR=1 FL=1|tara:strand:- start:166 stop:429 length:264 start_codon:yes stop_codon:yes gene_type:complete
MRIFLYKLLITLALVFILYKITIGQTIKQIETKLEYLSSKDNITFLKEKLRDEIRSSLTKERYIEKADADLINALIDKIKKDLKSQK